MGQKPSKITKVILDGDVLVYRAAFSTQDKPPEEAEKVLDQIMDYTIGKTVVFPHGNNFYCWLTGKGNFRYDVAKTEEYKANRRDTVKPPTTNTVGTIFSLSGQHKSLKGVKLMMLS